MLYIFPSLIIALLTLLLYFSYRNKTKIQIANLSNEPQKASYDRDMLQGNYNKILDDTKKQEELKKSRELDEMQLLFTKVNMLDDKVTFFNTSFKNKLDSITSLLETHMEEIKKLAETPLVDLEENAADSIENYNFDEQNADANVDNHNYDNSKPIKENLDMDSFLNSTEAAEPSIAETSETYTDNTNVPVNQDTTIDNEINAANTIYSNEEKVDNEIQENTVDTNVTAGPFDDEAVPSMGILDSSVPYPEDSDMEDDEELNSALKDLDNINVDLQETNSNTVPTENVEFEAEEDGDESEPEEVSYELAEENPAVAMNLSNYGFDIKDSIEKLKAQLNATNGGDKNS